MAGSSPSSIIVVAQVVPDFVGATDVVLASAVKDLLTGTRPRAMGAQEIPRPSSSSLAKRHAVAAATPASATCRSHSANGYLMSQFLTPYTNRRDDEYGGSLERRTRFAREVLGAIRRRVGADFPVIIKMNGADAPLARWPGAARTGRSGTDHEAAGVDAVEISVGHYESGFPMVRGSFGRCLQNMLLGSMAHLPPWRRTLLRVFRPLVTLACNLLWKGREGFNLDYTPAFKARLRIPVVSVGGFRTRQAMEAAIARGLCDAVSADALSR